MFLQDLLEKVFLPTALKSLTLLQLKVISWTNVCYIVDF